VLHPGLKLEDGHVLVGLDTNQYLIHYLTTAPLNLEDSPQSIEMIEALILMILMRYRQRNLILVMIGMGIGVQTDYQRATMRRLCLLQLKTDFRSGDEETSTR
jgi:hypothetical protein